MYFQTCSAYPMHSGERYRTNDPLVYLYYGQDTEIIESFNSTSKYMDDMLNIDNIYFDGIFEHIYPSELQLDKANTSDTEAPFLDLHLTISSMVLFLLKFMINATILILIL